MMICFLQMPENSWTGGFQICREGSDCDDRMSRHQEANADTATHQSQSYDTDWNGLGIDFIIFHDLIFKLLTSRRDSIIFYLNGNTLFGGYLNLNSLLIIGPNFRYTQ